MIKATLVGLLTAGAIAAASGVPSAQAAFRVTIVVPSSIALAQGAAPAKDKAEKEKAEKEKGQKAQKAAKEKETKAKSSERSNKSGELRGQERAQEVQGMQDSGRGAQQRSQRPAK